MPGTKIQKKRNYMNTKERPDKLPGLPDKKAYEITF